MTDGSRFNLDELLHPALAFSSPAEVASDPDLTLQEKRAILSSWASDACAVEAMPEIRSHPSGSTARFDEIIGALRELDRRRPDKSLERALKKTRRSAIFKRRPPNNDGSPLGGQAALTERATQIDDVHVQAHEEGWGAFYEGMEIAGAYRTPEEQRPLHECSLGGC